MALVLVRLYSTAEIVILTQFIFKLFILYLDGKSLGKQLQQWRNGAVLVKVVV